MIRGQTRPLPVVAEVENPNEIKAKFNASIHNRFDVEVVDANTGEIRQRAQAENVVLNSYWSNIWLNTSSGGNNQYIQYGSGSGIPTASDTALFQRVGSKTVSASDDVITNDTVNRVFSVRRKITLGVNDAIGVTLTEVGFGSVLVTHAMLKDMNGNQISIAKTDTDIINIYGTIFIRYPSIQGVELKDGIFKMICGMYNFYSPNTKGSHIYVDNSQSEQFVGFSVSSDLNAKKFKIDAGRISSELCNSNGIKTILISSTGAGNAGELIAFSFPNAIYPGSNIVSEAIGTGDGAKKDFATYFTQASSVKVYVDGVEQTSGVTFDAPSGTVSNNIHFATAPAVGAVITADYHTDIIAKDANHVFDFSMEIQLGEYAPT